MIIEMAPHLWGEILYSGINHCCSGYQQCQRHGKDRVEVIPVYDHSPTPADEPDAIGGTHHDKEGKEDEQVGVGEEIDKPRDGIIGFHITKHATLLYPALCSLVMGEFHPNGIDGVCRDIDDVGHYHTFAWRDDDRVFTLTCEVVPPFIATQFVEDHRVALDHEVEVLRIMVCTIERDRVLLFVCKAPSVGSLTRLIITRRERCCKEEQQAKHVADYFHYLICLHVQLIYLSRVEQRGHSSDNAYNQTVKGTRDRRIDEGRAVLSMKEHGHLSLHNSPMNI